MVKAFLRGILPKKNPASLREKLAEKMILDVVSLETSAEELESYVHVVSSALPRNKGVLEMVMNDLSKVRSLSNFEVQKKVENKAADLVSVYKLLESKGLFKKLVERKIS
jgi:hypothetical protein